MATVNRSLHHSTSNFNSRMDLQFVFGCRCHTLRIKLLFSKVISVCLLLCAIGCVGGHWSVEAMDVPFVYHNYISMTKTLQQLNSAYPELTRLYTIGKSEQGRELWVLVVSKFPVKRSLLMPAVKYIGNMHGNEPVTREVIIHFANYLLENNDKLAEVTQLLNTTQIHLMPSMNPDGFELAVEGECTGVLGRYNARLIDLNRNFPDTERENSVPRATETLAVMSWLDQQKPFVLSANFHGGALVASYAYDNYRGTSHAAVNSPTPDDDVFRHLAATYATNHERMRLSNSCGDNFRHGITNGAEWFQQNGSMQDYNYAYKGVIELTIELGCCKYPLQRYLTGYFEENVLPMLRFIQQVHTGVKGVVYDVTDNNPIVNASVMIVGRFMAFKTSKRGEYFRIVLPGTYGLRVQADGYNEEVIPISTTAEAVTVRNIFLTPLPKLKVNVRRVAALPAVSGVRKSIKKQAIQKKVLPRVPAAMKPADIVTTQKQLIKLPNIVSTLQPVSEVRNRIVYHPPDKIDKNGKQFKSAVKTRNLLTPEGKTIAKFTLNPDSHGTLYYVPASTASKLF